MSHIVQLPLPDEIYSRLAAYAAQRGAPVESVLLDVLEHGIERLNSNTAIDTGKAVYDPSLDPLAEFLGAFEADVPDLVQRHDAYLGEVYAKDGTSDD